MSVWTPSALRASTGGSWIRRPAGRESEPLCDSLSTDTRSVGPGQAFLALRGERFDAHEFLDSAVSAGAALLIVDRSDAVPESMLRAPTGPAIFRVGDTRRALGQIAAAHRRALDGTKVIAVAGSNGKTTTTRLIEAALRPRLRGSASPKSFNNDVGVPLTILAARRGDQYLVCEVGSNHPGETAALARIVQPDIAVLTSVGRDHLEHFGSVEAIAREHGSLLADVRPGGLVIAPAGEARLADFLRPMPNVVTFGVAADADLRLTSAEHATLAGGVLGLRCTINERWSIELPLLGEHNALNAVAAAAVGRRLGLDEPSIAEGLAAASPADMRLNRRVVAGVELIVDCYNSNPDSLEAALRTLAAVCSDPSRRVLVLGDMLELGEHAAAAHEEALAAAARLCPARVMILVGEAFAAAPGAAHASCETLRVPSSDDAAALARSAAAIRAGDTVLLKASRGVRLERLIPAIEARRESARATHIRPKASSV